MNLDWLNLPSTVASGPVEGRKSYFALTTGPSSSTSEWTLSSRATTSTSLGIRPSTSRAFFRSEPYPT